MLGQHPVIAFVATTDPARAIAFYRDVLGLRLVADEAFAIVFDAHGTMLRIQKSSEVVTPPYTTLGWQVADARATARALRERGVEPVRYGFPGQDDDGVWTAPDGTRVVWFRDPDGHTLSLTEMA